MPFTLQVDIVSAETQVFSGKAERWSPHRSTANSVSCHITRRCWRASSPAWFVSSSIPTHEESVFVSGVFIEVQPYVVTILADTAQRSRDLDEAAARAAKERIEKELGGRRPAPADCARLKAELDLAIAIVRSLEHLRDLKRRR